MTGNKLLLCTDMDATIIPSGSHLEHPEARERFRNLCSCSEVRLAYVSSWSLDQVTRAIMEYNLPMPNHIITDVGTKIYRHHQGAWDEVGAWQKEISHAWNGKGHAELQHALAACQDLKLQESSNQNEFKLSYYLSLRVPPKQILNWVEQQLAQQKVEFELSWSIDEVKRVGLLDILPRNAGKRDAIEFLLQELNLNLDQVLFAGDSGSDLPVLSSPIRSVLVANAEAEIRKQAIELSAAYDCSERLYLARSENNLFDGNYAAGVLQGIYHFFPEFINESSRRRINCKGMDDVAKHGSRKSFA
ncbi:HAD-IIB family hydrolase [Malonomonas rubra]|uniref:HAD-IIB family hydrolase n=1 Tax=Malonomonas rubra TaxID=57040 RepID=UPI0026F0C173|nr:HAD-IIB family hydrolase [Malonomonas rubra]